VYFPDTGCVYASKANGPYVGTPLLSRLKSTKSVDGTPSQSITRSSTDSGD